MDPITPPFSSGSYVFGLQGQELTLLPDKALYWQEQKALLVADVHLGKAGHFRKAGIPVPGQVHWEDLQRLSLLIEAWQPKQLIILGDLFHSQINNEWLIFEQWCQAHCKLEVILVKGNHDILPDSAYKIPNLTVQAEPWVLPPFALSHHPGSPHIHYYTLTGHLHPAIRLRGRGRQSLTLPCFYFGEKEAILPAFGQFTGHAIVKTPASSQVFGITEDRIIPLTST